METYKNQTVKSQIQKDNFESSKRKQIITYKGNPLPIRLSVDSFSRTLTCQKGLGGYIQSPEEKIVKQGYNTWQNYPSFLFITDHKLLSA